MITLLILEGVSFNVNQARQSPSDIVLRTPGHSGGTQMPDITSSLIWVTIRSRLPGWSGRLIVSVNAFLFAETGL